MNVRFQIILQQIFRMSASCLNNRPQLDVSVPLEVALQTSACCALSENLTQFDFGEFPHHPLEMNTSTILNDPHE
jgi:hypothetical protein